MDIGNQLPDQVLIPWQGPRGLDKILISPDGDITVTNDGATILGQVRSPDPLLYLLCNTSPGTNTTEYTDGHHKQRC